MAVRVGESTRQLGSAGAVDQRRRFRMPEQHAARNPDEPAERPAPRAARRRPHQRDERPRPQYGEYAPEGWTWQPPRGRDTPPIRRRRWPRPRPRRRASRPRHPSTAAASAARRSRRHDHAARHRGARRLARDRHAAVARPVADRDPPGVRLLGTAGGLRALHARPRDARHSSSRARSSRSCSGCSRRVGSIAPCARATLAFWLPLAAGVVASIVLLSSPSSSSAATPRSSNSSRPQADAASARAAGRSASPGGGLRPARASPPESIEPPGTCSRSRARRRRDRARSRRSWPCGSGSRARSWRPSSPCRVRRSSRSAGQVGPARSTARRCRSCRRRTGSRTPLRRSRSRMHGRSCSRGTAGCRPEAFHSGSVCRRGVPVGPASRIGRHRAPVRLARTSPYQQEILRIRPSTCPAARTHGRSRRCLAHAARSRSRMTALYCTTGFGGVSRTPRWRSRRPCGSIRSGRPSPSPPCSRRRTRPSRRDRARAGAI